MRKLDDSQLKDFDTEYVVGNRWETITSCIDRDFPSGEFSFLDVGGGNGKFADRLLSHYPKATGTVLDDSEYLLSRNSPDDRKTLLHKSVENLAEVTEKYDIVCVHWLLHHLVSGNYGDTRQNQLLALERVRELLTDRGRVSVFENIYTGWWIENLPGWLIFRITSIKALANITRRMGANTGGIGVCFQAETPWRKSIGDANFWIDNYAEPDDWVWPLRPLFRVLLHLKMIRVGHFWLRVA